MTKELLCLLLTAMLTGVLWIPVVIGYVATRGFPRPVAYKAAPTSHRCQTGSPAPIGRI